MFGDDIPRGGDEGRGSLHTGVQYNRNGIHHKLAWFLIYPLYKRALIELIKKTTSPAPKQRPKTKRRFKS